MFEKWAISCADKIKKINPDETEPHDVLVFGFTILFNLFFTTTLILLFGWILGVPFLTIQVLISFMIVRLLTGGAHLDHSLACSITSIIIVLTFVWLPATHLLLICYFTLAILLLLRYAPYYEPHQVQHSKGWERKKKTVAILWVILCIAINYFFDLPGLVFGTLLQALMVTPFGIRITHSLNKILSKGGEKYEKNC